jgi:hypothetical protein
MFVLRDILAILFGFDFGILVCFDSLGIVWTLRKIPKIPSNSRKRPLLIQYNAGNHELGEVWCNSLHRSSSVRGTFRLLGTYHGMYL